MPKQPSPGRLEAFSDGVIAVIITIMVLEFKVPDQAGWAGFHTILPTLAVYALSYAFTGIYWINHHHIIDRLKRVDGLILWTNLLFLFCLSLLPFFTDYVVKKRLDSFSVAVYSASLLVTGMGFTALTYAIVRHLRHAPQAYELDAKATAAIEQETAEQVNEQRKGMVSLVMYLGGIGLAYWHPVAALVDVGLVTVLWIVPSFGVRPHHPREPGAIGEWRQ